MGGTGLIAYTDGKIMTDLTKTESSVRVVKKKVVAASFYIKERIIYIGCS